MNLKSVKDRLKDETLDLSLCELKEVPVREIATIKKATNLDLSNNLLTFLPSTFVDLKQIVKLDLSRNMITELPENFGELRQLKHLDLYANQISRLPLSLGELKNLRWLDLKENPLTPAVASVAGPCSNLSECQSCARNVVTYLSHVKLSIEEEKLRRQNASAMEQETDAAVTKKAGKKKKKKKQGDKNEKQSLEKNGSNSSSKVARSSDGEINDAGLRDDKKDADKQHRSTGNGWRFIASLFTSLLFFCLAISLTIVVLPLYSKQSELFMDNIEINTGIPLNAFRKHANDTLYASMQSARDVYDSLYYTYTKNFQTETDIPAQK